MGTSASNTGPSKETPLLPPWAPNGEPEIPPPPKQPDSPKSDTEKPERENEKEKKDEQKIPLSGDWSSARRSLTSYVNNPSNSNLIKAIKSYIRSSGGSQSASKSSVSGKRTAIGLGNFLGSISTVGVQETFRRFNIGDLKGISAEVAMNRIVAALSPSGGTIEEAVSQAALLDTLEKLYVELGMQKNGLEALENITTDLTKILLAHYISSYVYNRWLHELWLKVEEKDISTAKIISYEKQIGDFIQESVKYEFGTIEFNNQKSLDTKLRSIMDDLFLTCYKTLEAL